MVHSNDNDDNAHSEVAHLYIAFTFYLIFLFYHSLPMTVPSTPRHMIDNPLAINIEKVQNHFLTFGPIDLTPKL